MPQYSSATLTAGLTASPWNGATGGVLAIDVSGALDLGGATVSVDGLGFRGGGARQLAGDTGGNNTDYVQASGKNFDGAKGEGIAGTPGWIYDAASGATAASGTDYPNNNTTRRRRSGARARRATPAAAGPTGIPRPTTRTRAAAAAPTPGAGRPRRVFLEQRAWIAAVTAAPRLPGVGDARAPAEAAARAPGTTAPAPSRAAPRAAAS